MKCDTEAQLGRGAGPGPGPLAAGPGGAETTLL